MYTGGLPGVGPDAVGAFRTPFMLWTASRITRPELQPERVSNARISSGTGAIICLTNFSPWSGE